MPGHWKCPNCGSVFEKTAAMELFQGTNVVIHDMGGKGIWCPSCQTPLDLQKMMAGEYDHSLVSTPQSDGAGSSSCFVATAVYGDPCHPNVLVLRRWRDRRLLTHPLGRAFVRLYYKLGPLLARPVRSGWLPVRPFRVALDAFVRKVR